MKAEHRMWVTWGRLLGSLLIATAVVGCGGDDDGGAGDDDPDGGDNDGPVLKRESKSSSIAITGDDKFVAMVNPENDSLSVFDTSDDSRIARVLTGDEPSSVVIHPDDKTAFVANRAAATVVKIKDLTSANPTIDKTIEVGSEPTGVALSPSGKYLYVAEFAEGRVSVWDTGTMASVGVIDAPKNPKAIAVTNNGDNNDADELLIVPEFFGEPTGTEATDTSRTGRVRIYGAVDLQAQDPIVFSPRASGFGPIVGGAEQAEVMTSPNQLGSVVAVGSLVYVTSISASPAGPFNFQANVQPVVYVGDLDTRTEVTGVNGTMNLAKLVKDQIPADSTPPRLFLADLSDIAFVNTTVIYTVSKGAEVMQRVELKDSGPELGSPVNEQVDLLTVPSGSTKPCQNPTGIVTAHGVQRAYVNCWVTRQLGVINLKDQVLSKTVTSDDISVDDNNANLGRHFFFTARGRWSQGGWSSCGSCHPDGLSDNITWSFGAGPRQTTSMDGSFTHTPGKAQVQRAFNWTPINDEIHDFERNTRGVSGGKGAITRPGVGKDCGNVPGGDLAAEVQVALGADGLVPSVPAGGTDAVTGVSKELQDAGGTCTKDWDRVEDYVKTIRPPRALRFLDAASVARGALIFADESQDEPNAAGCVTCHGGDGWTASKRFYTPTSDTIDDLVAANLVRPAGWRGAGVQNVNFHTKHIAPQPAFAGFPGAQEDAPIAPNQLACAIRNVATFGIPGDEAATTALEFKNGNAQARAQGRLGYNVPSLYGLALGAPYLHHGQAADLEALFTDPKWQTHATQASSNWLVTGSAAAIAQRKADLINFLLSIDAKTEVQALPANQDGCKL